ncbi:hypothetical protein B0H63DRAFT_560926 [Podospora didyma]|uniref:Zn(2)-C6 fungal-type domain-containing protein n=1 Tax=Podospora didyma TaxID=330526 RepID=A0AAE0TVQ2_9PEZI|nr:hypothetical protein B0H63DRAFT_560926 [Podospora didyma]
METSGSRRLAQQLKLKDSCDPCSTSKVKCTKEKPICARCDKFGHRCYYSPARRIGRPHRPPNANTNNTGTSSSSSSSSSLLQHQHQNQKPPISPSHSTHHQSGSRSSRSTPPPPLPPPISWASSASSSSNSPSAIIDISTAMPYIESSPPQIADSHTCLLLQDPPSPAPDTAIPDTSNCHGLLLGIIGANLNSNKPPSLTEASSFITSSVTTLSRVLICPCSQDLDVALLAVAGCNVVLDVVDDLATEFPYNSSSGTAGTSNGEADPNQVIVGELRRVANLVVQFTSRYETGMEDEVSEALIGLAGELKTRLQAVVEKATSDVSSVAV